MRHLRIYRAIEAIVEAGSIRKAAESLAISPSALNRSIQAFEAELGTEIFERVAGGVRLSVPGELLLRPIIEHVAQIDDFQGLIAEMKGGQAGTLRLSVSADLWPGLAANVIEEFRAKYPGIGLDVSLSETAEPVVARTADLALVTVPATHDELDVLVSGEAPVVGLLADGAGRKIGLADIADLCLIAPPRGSGLRQALDVMLRRTGVTPGRFSVLPGHPHTLRSGALPDLAFGLGDHPAEARVDISALRLPDIQITLLGRRGGYRPRAADQFILGLGRALDRYGSLRAGLRSG